METSAPIEGRFSAWRHESMRSPGALATMIAGSLSLILIGGGAIAVVAVRGFTPYLRIVNGIQSTEGLLVVISGMVLGAAAIVAGYSTYRRMPTKRSRDRALAGAILGIQGVALGVLLLLFREVGDPERFVFHFLNFDELEGYGLAFVNGVKNTLILAVVGEAGGIVLGVILAVLVISERRVVRAPARAYINFFRGTPLIWQLSVFYFGFSIGLGFNIGTFQIAMLVFVLNTGAYASEVFRAGIQSIERGQMEAARSLGMSYPQAMWNAIIPQAFRRVIPPLMNEFVILIKDTSLVIVLGLTAAEYEVFTVAQEGYSDTFNATFFVAAAAAYLVVTLPLIRAVNMVERRLRSGLVTLA